MSAAAAAAAAATNASKIAQRSVGKLSPDKCAFFLCDIQDRFRPLIYNSQTIINTSNYLTSMANELSVPIIATQQYTKVFGPTVTDCFANGQEDLDRLVGMGRVFEKKKFSMMTDQVQELMGSEEFRDRHSIVLFGIEAHVCVQQTCLDLLEMGKEVHVVCDGVSSQQSFDREIALGRMAHAGAFLTTAQSIAFMLMQSEYNEHSSVSLRVMYCVLCCNDAIVCMR
jgi:Amidases related to nicotinamidase